MESSIRFFFRGSLRWPPLKHLLNTAGVRQVLRMPPLTSTSLMRCKLGRDGAMSEAIWTKLSWGQLQMLGSENSEPKRVMWTLIIYTHSLFMVFSNSQVIHHLMYNLCCFTWRKTTSFPLGCRRPVVVVVSPSGSHGAQAGQCVGQALVGCRNTGASSPGVLGWGFTPEKDGKTYQVPPKKIQKKNQQESASCNQHRFQETCLVFRCVVILGLSLRR